MFVAVHIANFRMLSHNYLYLPGRFQVLVGQNGTGKTTFFAAIQLVANVLRQGAHKSLFDLSPNFLDLCFDPGRPALAIALEFKVPESSDKDVGFIETPMRLLRYELELGPSDRHKMRLGVLRENLFHLTKPAEALPSRSGSEAAAFSVLQDPHNPPRNWKTLLAKTADGRTQFHRADGTVESWRSEIDVSAFSLLPAETDEDEYGLHHRARAFLAKAPQLVQLNIEKVRKPAPPNQPTQLACDGANLALTVRRFREADPILFGLWEKHVALAIKGLSSIEVIERPEDRHLYLCARFSGQHDQLVPSWLLSDGTLRLMALSLIGFFAEPAESEKWSPALWMIEQPEDGLHPLAMESICSALSDPQLETHIMLSTHSPVFLANVAIEQTLVFRRAPEGHAIICHGTEIPDLKDWHGRFDMAHLLASGILS
jgi:hypothetical protein